MELRHLRYFVAVAEEEHLGRAARRLHVSPPPLSKQIRELEGEIGVPLFARVGRGIRLTDGGRTFLVFARGVLAEVARGVAAARASARGEAGRVTLAFTETLTHAQLVPEIVAQLRRSHPGVGVALQPVVTAQQREALSAGRVDIALGFGRPSDPGLRWKVLLAEDVLVALPRAHRLARRATVTPRDLRDEPFVWVPRAVLPEALQQAAAKLATRGYAINVITEAVSTDVRLAMVAAGMGLTFVLESAAPLVPRGVVLRPVSAMRLNVETILAWRAADDGSAMVGAVRAAAEEAARAHEARRRPSRRRGAQGDGG